jgi:hypothetical protein
MALTAEQISYVFRILEVTEYPEHATERDEAGVLANDFVDSRGVADEYYLATKIRDHITAHIDGQDAETRVEDIITDFQGYEDYLDSGLSINGNVGELQGIEMDPDRIRANFRRRMEQFIPVKRMSESLCKANARQPWIGGA